MPNFPIVDTHVHLTNLDRVSYPSLKHATELHRSFGLDDFRSACGPIHVGDIVFMEVACDEKDIIKEVQWVTELAAEEPRLKGIVAQAPLEEGAAVAATLEQFARNPLVKGIRRLIQEGEVCLQERFLEGLRLLSEFNFSFNICVSRRHLANVLKMVEQCPDVRFILDHIGGPDIQEKIFEPWKSEIHALSQFPNVTCKISGAATQADHQNWTRDDLRPYIDHVIESFSFDRVMFGSDWFVATLATTYPRWVETLDWTIAGCSDTEIKKFYRENAEVFYRLGV